METAECKGTELVGVLITLFLYADDITLLAKIHEDLDKQLRTLHVYWSKIGMRVNTNKAKAMSIKSKKTTNGSYVYNNECLQKFSSYKYLGIDFSHQLNSNYSIQKNIIGCWKSYYELENNYKSVNLYIIKKYYFLKLLLYIYIYIYIHVDCHFFQRSKRDVNLATRL